MLRVGRLPGQVVVAIDLHQDTAWSCMKLDVRVDDIQPRRCFDWRRLRLVSAILPRPAVPVTRKQEAPAVQDDQGRPALPARARTGSNRASTRSA